jgi:hypothetical protein
MLTFAIALPVLLWVGGDRPAAKPTDLSGLHAPAKG